LIEDKGSGTSLIQELRYENLSVIGIKPEGDKTTRLYSTQALFEAGSVLFPREAPWLQDLILELLAFPKYRHDDQVDSVSQALIWMRHRAWLQQDDDLGMPISVPKYPWWDCDYGS
jgi:predicted phage terminase large subunit-like protein